MAQYFSNSIQTLLFLFIFKLIIYFALSNDFQILKDFPF